MKANVTIWKVDRDNQSIVTPEFVNVNGTYSDVAVDEEMIKRLVTQFAYSKPNVTNVTTFNCGSANATWAFASDGPKGSELYLVRVVEIKSKEVL